MPSSRQIRYGRARTQPCGSGRVLPLPSRTDGGDLHGLVPAAQPSDDGAATVQAPGGQCKMGGGEDKDLFGVGELGR